jgi:hypothetical protein
MFTKDNEVAATIEIIISRYSFALTLLKSASGHIFQLREAAQNKNKEQVTNLVKEIKERIRIGTMRVYKLWGSENLLLPGLKNKTGPAEFFPGFSLVMKK